MPGSGVTSYLRKHDLTAICYWTTNVSRAVPLFEQALDGYRLVFGDDDPRTKIVLESLTLLRGSND